MKESLGALESLRNDLARRLSELGDFRRGSVSVNYRKCGKPNCACAQPNHSGHGPQYLWNATIRGKSVAQNLRLGPELEKVTKEVENYRHFVKLCKQLIEVNEKICRLRPVAQIEDEEELERLEKKLRRKFSKRRSKK
jgi:hypothetical protein